jgi:hypothetical protein
VPDTHHSISKDAVLAVIAVKNRKNRGQTTVSARGNRGLSPVFAVGMESLPEIWYSLYDLYLE